MKKLWLERFLDSIADKGRHLLARFYDEYSEKDMTTLCRGLLSGKGEASGTALSRELCQAYEGMDADSRLAFFEMLVREFGPDKDAIVSAANKYSKSGTDEDFLALYVSVEPPRQELFRRMNMAPRGTATLVRMRAELLELIPQHPHLKVIDADLKHLFSSWFNRGFLKLETINWHSPAVVLEKIIQNDMVHEVQGWDDLRRRLAPDRRCFAFFHPALPYEPLIFVEVALVRGMASEALPLLDESTPVIDPNSADTAMFYSINNTQRGLRNLSFGNLLIKQVLSELSAELPKLKVFATLSPMPDFASTIQAAIRDKHPEFTRARLLALIADYHDVLAQASAIHDAADALRTLLERGPLDYSDVLDEPLQHLALAYLTLLQHNGKYFDRVASFHLANGARLERIRPFADSSDNYIMSSYGFMVNYLYDPDEVVANHEQFVNSGRIAMSKHLSRVHDRIATDWKVSVD